MVDIDRETPRAIRLFLEHEPPSKGQGRLLWDDLALVTWETQPSYQLSPMFLRLDELSGPVRLSIVLQKAVRNEAD